MTQEEKQLLLKDLCGRLPYGVKYRLSVKGADVSIIDKLELGGLEHFIFNDLWEVKPYLRPMSSMTDEERKEYESFIFTQHHEWDGHGTSTKYVEVDDTERYVTWLNKKMFDYRGLIEKGLALEAPEGMYKTE